MPKRRTVEEFEQHDPFRRPDWRWQAAGELACGDVRRRGFGGTIKTALSFRRRQAAAVPHRRRPGPHDREIVVASAVFECDDPRRWALEYLVLADQPPSLIAQRCGLSPGAVRWYELLFFDVRQHLHATGWLTARLFGNRLWTGFADDELGLVWRHFALFGGVPILDLLIGAAESCRRRGLPLTISSCLSLDDVLPPNFLSALALKVLPPLGGLMGDVWDPGSLLATVGQPSDSPIIAELARRPIAAARAFLAGKPLPAPSSVDAARRSVGPRTDRVPKAPATAHFGGARVLNGLGYEN